VTATRNEKGAGTATVPTTQPLELPPARESDDMPIVRHAAPSGARSTGGRETPAARAVTFPPHAGRTRHLVLVGRCPLCTAAHALRPAELAASLGRRCPVTGGKYAAVVDLGTVPDVA
jgi:hypothetical protein